MNRPAFQCSYRRCVVIALSALALAGAARAQTANCPNTNQHCFIGGIVPGCCSAECCELVCAQDPFCCDARWDSICAAEATALCEGVPTCSNDLCAGAPQVFEGETRFSTIDATSSWDAPNPHCVPFPSFNQDIWFYYKATQTGTLRISACQSDFDSGLVVYTPCYCQADPVACSDDAPGCGSGVQARLDLQVEQFDCMFILIGGSGTASGAGVLTLGYVTPCAPDIDASGSANVDDLLLVIGGWGPCGSMECPTDVNGDYQTNVDDLLSVINGWGQCPG